MTVDVYLPHRWRSWTGALALAAGVVSPTCQAQAWHVESAVDTTFTANRNSGVAGATVNEGIGELTPSMRLTGKGSRFNLTAEASVEGIYYARSTQPNRALPRGELALNLIPLERWATIDSSVSIVQGVSNPYTLQGTSTIVNEYISTRRYRLNPAIDHDFTPSVSLHARSDHLWTKRSGDAISLSANRDSYVEHDSARLEARPQPLGGWVELSRDRTTYAIAAVSALDLDAIRSALTYAPNPELQLGLSVGKERSQIGIDRANDSIYGVNLDWKPTERSQAQMTVEHRFFGVGGSAELTHRSPFGAIVVRMRREPASQPNSLLLAPPNGNVVALLDSIYTTRVPDPAERAALVRNIIATFGLTPTISGPVEVFSNYVQLQDTASIYATLTGRLTTTSFGVFALKSSELVRRGASSSLLSSDRSADNFQAGVSLNMSRRITTSTSASLNLQVSRIRGLGVGSVDRSTEKVASLSFNHVVSPKTSVVGGLRWRALTSSLVVPTKEASVFVGGHHSF